MRHEIEIQRHGKVADLIGHNDMIQKTDEEKEAALAKYNTKKWETSQNGMTAVYVAAFDLDGGFVGGYCWVDGKRQQIINKEEEHKQMVAYF